MNPLVHARQSLRRAALGVLLAIAGAGGASAQAEFPTRPLKIIVPQPPGGGFDFVGRTLAEALRPAARPERGGREPPRFGHAGGHRSRREVARRRLHVAGRFDVEPGVEPGAVSDAAVRQQRDFEPLGVAVTYSYTLMARKDLAVDFAGRPGAPGAGQAAAASPMRRPATARASTCWRRRCGTWPASSWCTCRTAARRRPTKTCSAAASTCSSTWRRPRARRSRPAR